MRRLALLALVLDTLIGGALIFGAPLVDADPPSPVDAYVSVDGACMEVIDADTQMLAGRPVADALCAAG